MDSSFINFDVVHEGEDVIAIGSRIFFFALGEALGEIVAEAAGFDICGEPCFFVVGAGDAIFASPHECVLIGRTGENLCFKIVIIDTEELAGPEVHAESKIGMKFRVEGPGVMFANLITHARKVDETFNFVASGPGCFVVFFHALNEAGKCHMSQ